MNDGTQNINVGFREIAEDLHEVIEKEKRTGKHEILKIINEDDVVEFLVEWDWDAKVMKIKGKYEITDLDDNN